MPLKLLHGGAASQEAGFVSIRMEEVALVGSLNAKDFNSRSRSSFQTQSDLVRSVSVTFDFLVFMHH